LQFCETHRAAAGPGGFPGEEISPTVPRVPVASQKCKVPAPGLALLALCCSLSMATASAASAEPSEAELSCTEWADAFFSSATEARQKAIARCIAERDSNSPEAKAQREAARLEEAARADRERREQTAWSEWVRGEADAARSKCGELIQAWGPLHFCDSEETVTRKVEAADDIRCASRPRCDRLKLTGAATPLAAYPTYFEGGLSRISFYTTERDNGDYTTKVQEDWRDLVSLAEKEFGSATDGTLRLPGSFSVQGVHVVYTHHWNLGRKRIRVGVFEGAGAYAATMLIEDAARASASR
jgi:hypothetical protein